MLRLSLCVCVLILQIGLLPTFAKLRADEIPPPVPNPIGPGIPSHVDPCDELRNNLLWWQGVQRETELAIEVLEADIARIRTLIANLQADITSSQTLLQQALQLGDQDLIASIEARIRQLQEQLNNANNMLATYSGSLNWLRTFLDIVKGIITGYQQQLLNLGC